jgi:hypothetical protein
MPEEQKQCPDDSLPLSRTATATMLPQGSSDTPWRRLGSPFGRPVNHIPVTECRGYFIDTYKYRSSQRRLTESSARMSGIR